jgi:holo-[acyl-carrier protein] synthase
MIVGIGTDIIEIARIGSTIDSFGKKFLDRVFTKSEQERVNKRNTRQHASYAKLYAAKEAVLKALGSGLANGINWHEINVCHLPSGQPYITLSGRALEIAYEKSAKHQPDFACHVSLSDDDTHAIGYAVIETI